MSGENIRVMGTTKALETAGVALSNGALASASVATYDITADGAGFPDGIFALTCQFGTSPGESSIVALYAQPLLVDGTNDSQTPETSRPTRFLGTFVLDNVTTLQAMELLVTDLPRKARYYLHNYNTGQSMTAGWKLSVAPTTYKVAA